MKSRGTLALALVLLSGCDKTAPANGPATAAAATNMSATNFNIPGWPPTKAQPRLPVIKLFINGHLIDAEAAIQPVQLATGMMFRETMGADEGMLFVFAEPQEVSFYMRNTIVPLQLAYIDRDGVIQELHELQPKNESPVPSRTNDIQFVLEMNTGWFDRNQISTGAVVRSEAGGLRNAFNFGRGSPPPR